MATLTGARQSASLRLIRRTYVVERKDIFATPDTIATFESLSCQDAVEFVDGVPATATR